MLYVVYFVSKFCPEKHDAFIFFHTISVIINRLTLQPKGEGCLTTHQSHCNRLVFCKPIELHRYKAGLVAQQVSIPVLQTYRITQVQSTSIIVTKILAVLQTYRITQVQSSMLKSAFVN